MPNFAYYNWTGGINLLNSALSADVSENRTEWTDAENVEYWGQGGFAKMLGNQTAINTGTGTKILGVGQYIKKNYKIFVFVYSDGTEGHFCEGDLDEGTYEVIKSGLDPDARCSFENYIDGVAVSNGVDDPFIWTKRYPDEIQQQPTITQCNLMRAHGSVGRIMTNFKGRLFSALVKDGTLCYSAIGDGTTWDKDNDSGYITNFHGSSSPVTAIVPYGESLAIYREGETFLLQGSSPDDFVLRPFANNKGSASPYAALNYDNKQLFYDEGVFALEYGTQQQIQMSKEFSYKISPAFQDLNESMADQITTVTLDRERQVWFFMCDSNTSNELNVVWIMDRKDFKNIGWYKRRATPCTCACNFDGEIYTGTSDGRILKENIGNTLDGEEFSSYWYSPWFTFKDPRLKSIETGVDILFDGEKRNDCTLTIRYNTITSKTRYKTINTVPFGQCIFGSGRFGINIFRDNRSIIKRVNIPGVFKSLQLGFECTGEFAVNGLAFFDIMLEE